MKLLTQREVNGMSKDERTELLYKLQDLACNIDYIANPIESDMVHRNISMIESKITFKEY